jgi:uncharacterized protein YggU (UPF0235/DUF167 family)
MYIKVKVKTGQKAESFEKKNEDTFFATVKAEAERNEANKRVISLVSRHFKIPSGKVKIVKGHKMPSKIINVNI